MVDLNNISKYRTVAIAQKLVRVWSKMFFIRSEKQCLAQLGWFRTRQLDLCCVQKVITQNANPALDEMVNCSAPTY